MPCTMNESAFGTSTLVCIWIPTHAGPNAPLMAIWIETPCRMAAPRHDLVRNSTEGDSWAFAA
jgi:hypothetical protein